MRKTLEILIVAVILFAIALVVGCKDEVEVVELNTMQYWPEKFYDLQMQISKMNAFLGIMLSDDIEVNGEKQRFKTVEERLILARKTFKMMAECQKEDDPNQFWSPYDIGSICISFEEPCEPNEPERFYR